MVGQGSGRRFVPLLAWRAAPARWPAAGRSCRGSRPAGQQSSKPAAHTTSCPVLPPLQQQPPKKQPTGSSTTQQQRHVQSSPSTTPPQPAPACLRAIAVELLGRRLHAIQVGDAPPVCKPGQAGSKPSQETSGGWLSGGSSAG